MPFIMLLPLGIISPRCCKLDIHGPEANFWEDLEFKIVESIRNTLDRRVQFYEDELRKLSEQRFMPVWNFCNFFILKVFSLFKSYRKRKKEKCLSSLKKLPDVLGTAVIFAVHFLWVTDWACRMLGAEIYLLLLIANKGILLQNISIWQVYSLHIFSYSVGKLGFYIWNGSTSWRCIAWIWRTRTLLLGDRYVCVDCHCSFHIDFIKQSLFLAIYSQSAAYYFELQWMWLGNRGTLED